MHHIHDPATVAAFDRGAEAAGLYPDWAWSLDAAGAGWSCVPLDIAAAAGRRGREGGSARRARPRTLPPNWPAGVVYAPFLLWVEPAVGGARADAADAATDAAGLASARMEMAQWRCMGGVSIQPLPPKHPAAAPVGAAGVSAGAFGLFASVTLPCGAVLGNYTGLVKPQERTF